MHMHTKRTTLVLDAHLLTELRRTAADEGRTLTEIVERTLRLGLATQASPRRTRVQLPSFDLGPFLSDPSVRAADGPSRERG